MGGPKLDIPATNSFRNQFDQRVEQSCISTMVDEIVVNPLLGLLNRQQAR